MKKIVNKKIITLVLSIVFLLGFMALTNPEDIPLAFLLVPFFLTALIVFITVEYLISFFQKDKKNTSRSIIFSAVLAIIIMNFLILRSIGQLTIQDGLISAAITVILAVYIKKFQIKS